VKGVPFKSDPKGSDVPTDPPSEDRTLEYWHEYGGLWEDGFRDMSVVPGRNYSVRCFSDFNSFIMENTVTPGTGACPAIPAQPMFPRTATMRPEWTPALKMGLQKLFGRVDEPSFEDVELR
jgi:hypothetical protein